LIHSIAIQDPLQKPILEELFDHFKHQKIKFYLIGATARDIIMSLHNEKSFEIEIASLEGIFLLKLIAWNDRHKKGNKDTDDMCFIINNYLSIYG